MNMKDLYWLAGLLEGEGSFQGIMGPKGLKVTIVVQMADRDVVARVARIMKTPSLTGPIVRQGIHRKPMWSTAVYGRTAIAWMFMLHPLMGARRKEAIVVAVSAWKKLKVYRTAPKAYKVRDTTSFHHANNYGDKLVRV